MVGEICQLSTVADFETVAGIGVMREADDPVALAALFLPVGKLNPEKPPKPPMKPLRALFTPPKPPLPPCCGRPCCGLPGRTVGRAVGRPGRPDLEVKVGDRPTDALFGSIPFCARELLETSWPFWIRFPSFRASIPLLNPPLTHFQRFCSSAWLGVNAPICGGRTSV